MAEKMTAEEYQEYTRKEMLRIAHGILSGTIEIVDGCRRLSELVPRDLEEPSISIQAFVSETDIYPLGETRAGYESSYLAKLDAQREKYSEQSKPWIFQACRKIIQRFTSPQDSEGYVPRS